MEIRRCAEEREGKLGKWCLFLSKDGKSRDCGDKQPDFTAPGLSKIDWWLDNVGEKHGDHMNQVAAREKKT